jgi:hypothetical protein
MQGILNTRDTQEQPSNKEVIAFYGDLTSVNAEDVVFRGSATKESTVLSFVQSHQEDTYFTMMYTQEMQIPKELEKEIASINPHTQFVQINSIGEFAEYYDNGSKTMDRELYPVESVKMLSDSLFYDVKEREQPKVEKEQQVPREYLKISDISLREGISDLNEQINKITEYVDSFDKNKIEKTQEFLDTMGLQGYDPTDGQVQSQVEIVKRELHQEFVKDYTLPIAGKTAIDNLDVMLPSKVGNSVDDVIEFTHDLLGDTHEGKVKLDFECTSLSDCHIKGAYRELENEKILENKTEHNIHKEGIILEDNASRSYDTLEIMNEENQRDYDSYENIPKYEEIANQTYMPSQYDSSVDYGMEIGE